MEGFLCTLFRGVRLDEETQGFFVVMLVLCLTGRPALSDGGLQATLLLPESLRSLRSEWSNWSRSSGF